MADDLVPSAFGMPGAVARTAAPMSAFVCGRVPCVFRTEDMIMTERDVAESRDRLQLLATNLSGKVDTLKVEALRPTGTETMGGSSATADGEATDGGEVARSLLGAEGQMLAEVNAALERVDGGTFGCCETCEKPIAKARLDVVPYARQCIGCARQSEGGV